MEEEDYQALEKLVCFEIPDTRKLQQIRLNSIGDDGSIEKEMKKHHFEEWENISRLVRLSERDLGKVYGSSIPLTFSIREISGRGITKTDFLRWQGHCSNRGDTNLTTETNLNILLKIFFENGLKIKLERGNGPLYDIRMEEDFYADPAISVPHSFIEVQGLSRIQYLVCDQRVSAAPYYWKEEIAIRTGSDFNGSNVDASSYGMEELRETKYFCKAMYFSPDHCKDFLPESWLPKMLEKKNDRKISEWDKSRKGKLLNSKMKLLRIGEPIMIYDPTWIIGGKK